MKVSIVILAYNEQEFIGRLLDSLTHQSEEPDEILVVDNNSTDDTLNIVRRYPVRVIHEKKQGIVYARNTGFNSAQYELIIRFDADTVVPRDYIEKVKKIFTADKDLLAYSGRTQFEPLKHNIPTFWFEIPFNHTTRFLTGAAALVGTNLAIRKNAWNQVRDTLCEDGFSMHEDMDLAIHLSKIGKIRYDSQLGVKASSRRVERKPSSFFIKYTWMGFNTFLRHKVPFLKL